jgi:hypothetical protein
MTSGSLPIYIWTLSYIVLPVLSPESLALDVEDYHLRCLCLVVQVHLVSR